MKRLWYGRMEQCSISGLVRTMLEPRVPPPPMIADLWLCGVSPSRTAATSGGSHRDDSLCLRVWRGGEGGGGAGGICKIVSGGAKSRAAPSPRLSRLDVNQKHFLCSGEEKLIEECPTEL
jgi:hypothetical protein